MAPRQPGRRGAIAIPFESPIVLTDLASDDYLLNQTSTWRLSPPKSDIALDQALHPASCSKAERRWAIHRLPAATTSRSEACSSLLAGGDFADGVISHLGALAGGQEFVTFDHTAVPLLTTAGQNQSDYGITPPLTRGT
jgi:hypothetical protein